MLIAEELEVGLDRIAVEPAPPDDKLHADPILRFQVTGNSSSIRGGFDRLRHAGAVGRTMLIAAAAQNWQADPASCRAERALFCLRRRSTVAGLALLWFDVVSSIVLEGCLPTCRGGWRPSGVSLRGPGQ